VDSGEELLVRLRGRRICCGAADQVAARAGRQLADHLFRFLEGHFREQDERKPCPVNRHAIDRAEQLSHTGAPIRFVTRREIRRPQHQQRTDPAQGSGSYELFFEPAEELIERFDPEAAAGRCPTSHLGDDAA
jgi:hypothetical protein